MKSILRYTALLCLAGGLLFPVLTGCSQDRNANFAKMSKDEQLRAWRNLPPEEVAINRKMWQNIQAQSKAAPGGRPTIQPPTKP
jgi:hypothetical protein